MILLVITRPYPQPNDPGLNSMTLMVAPSPSPHDQTGTTYDPVSLPKIVLVAFMILQ